MLNKTSLALAMETSYNSKKLIKPIIKPNVSDFSNNQFIKHTNRAMIMRENILASGMEITDIELAKNLVKIKKRS
jgi:hypothetical protein